MDFSQFFLFLFINSHEFLSFIVLASFTNIIILLRIVATRLRELNILLRVFIIIIVCEQSIDCVKEDTFKSGV